MIEHEIDQMLETNIMRCLGIRSHRIQLPLDLISIACLFLMVDRGAALKKTPDTPKERVNSETFFSDLTQTGIAVDGLAVKKFNLLIQTGYFSVDASECYAAEPDAVTLTGLLNRIFARMQGVIFVSYFIQTIEEVKSGRKTREQALDQAAQMLMAQGQELTPGAFSPEEKKYLKKQAVEAAQGGVAEKKNGQALSKRDKLFNVLTLRIKKKGGIPPLPYHAAKLKAVIDLDERSVKKIAEVVMTDFPMVIRLLEYVNRTVDLKEKPGIVSVSQALVALGCDKAKGVAQEVFFITETDEPLLKNDRELLCRFTLFKSMAARRIALSLDAESVEELCVNVMFCHFGLILIMYYLPEAYQTVKNMAITKNIDCDSAAREVLGATYETIGVKIGTDWKLPFNMIESMKISQQKRIVFSKSTLLRSMPCHLNDMCLAYTQMETDEENSIKTLTLLAESLCIPRNTLVGMLDTAWAEFNLHFSDDHQKVDPETFFSGIHSILA